jgi:two-component system sensor histidine kinase KdpD
LSEIDDKEKRAEQFLKLNQTDSRGKLKIYIGMSAGVGKTYRMLEEAHDLLEKGVNIKVGYVETHGRKETQALIDGLPVIPRREIFYKGKKLEELDVQSILLLHPDIVIVDELAHTNIPGSKNEKRWQDVMDILEAGVYVITAVNIQHIESINEDVKQITGVEVKERVPDKLLQLADEVVNIDLTAKELITRLKEGKIYDHGKVQQALTNFFQPEKILQLRELALRKWPARWNEKSITRLRQRKSHGDMNISLLVYHPIMKLHSGSFEKRQDSPRTITANGMFCMCKRRKNLLTKFLLLTNAILSITLRTQQNWALK